MRDIDILNVEVPAAGLRSCRLRHMRVLPLLGLLGSCSGSPTGPSPTPPTPPPPATYTVSGTVTATNGGQALGGLSVDIDGVTTTTDDAGHYTLTRTLGATAPSFRIAGPGVMPHSGYVTNGQAVADLDAIRFDGQFDPVFFRQFGRDGYQPIARWTQAPNFYIRTIDSQGHAVEARTIDVTRAALISTTPLWTAGSFGVGTIEQGPDSRAGVYGWTTVTWDAELIDPSCGESPVGDMRGKTMNFYYKKPSCSCVGSQISPSIVKHELGHMLGYHHTSNSADLMFSTQSCGAKDPSPRERYHAAIVYRRPNGNMDPDNDPRP